MQIGADIYCDSQIIVRELERRFPEPTLFPAGGAGLAQASALWTDRGFFQAAVAVIFGGLGDKVPDAFIRDRETLSGRPFDPSAMRAAVPHMTQQLRAHVGLISEQLQDGRAFLSGDQPGLVDANAYYNLWFVHSAYPPAAAGFEDLPRVSDWMSRVRQIGHGRRLAVPTAQALQVAREAQPDRSEPGQHELMGKDVIVAADDYGRDPVQGTLVGSTEFQLSVLRADPDLGEVVVHFPRIGFGLEEQPRAS
jgi:glutathione S-transferase